jgi:hypothetical protein
VASEWVTQNLIKRPKFIIKNNYQPLIMHSAFNDKLINHVINIFSSNWVKPYPFTLLTKGDDGLVMSDDLTDG